MKKSSNMVNIFWTGGLDSTFRLIQVLMTTKNQVQPHYIVRHEDSTGTEIDTMIKIRRFVIRKYPELRPRFSPTIYINEDLVPRYNDIDEKIVELKKIGKVAEQYQIMSNYCKANNIDQIDVALTSISGEKEFFKHFKNSPAFKSFIYPVIEISKREMLRISKANDWDDILNMTSFCRRPKKKIKPCGVCGPCVDAVMVGMGYRLPISSRIKANIQIPLRNYWRKNYLKHNDSGFFQLIKKKFENKL